MGWIDLFYIFSLLKNVLTGSEVRNHAGAPAPSPMKILVKEKAAVTTMKLEEKATTRAFERADPTRPRSNSFRLPKRSI